MPYGFRSPVADGKIWSPTEGTADLSIAGDNKLPYAESVEIDEGIGGNYTIKVTLATPYEKAIELIDDTGWFRLGNTLAVRWGYNDGDPTHISDWYYGFMLPPEPDFNSEEVIITLQARGYEWIMNRTESVRVWGTHDAPMTFEDVATKISTKYGLRAPEFLLSTDTQRKYMQEKRVDMIQGGLTDFMYLANEAYLAGVEMVFRQDHLLFLGRQTDAEQGKVACEFRFRGKPDLANNIYPMMAFRPKSFGPLFLAKAGSYMGASFGFRSDPSKEPEMIVANNATDQANNPGGSDVLTINGADGPANEIGIKQSVLHEDGVEAVKFMPVTMTDKDFDEQATQQLDGMRVGDASDHGIEVEIDTVAIPTIFPGQHVRLSGVSRYFSTEYKIMQKTVTISGNGADMSLTLGSKGLPEGLEQLVQRANVSNQGEVENSEGNAQVEPKVGATT